MPDLTPKQRRARIKDMHKQIRSMLTNQFADRYESGVVRELPVTESVVRMPSNWSQQCIFRGPSFDIWYHQAPAGTEIPRHVTPDHTIVIIVTQGAADVTVETDTNRLEANDTIQVLQGQYFGIKAGTDTDLFFIYYPPISKVVDVGTAQDTMSKTQEQVVHIMYTSFLKEHVDIKDVVQQSQKVNDDTDLSGILLYNEQTRRVIQLLEGCEPAITDTYRRIYKDTRHSGLKTLLHLDVRKRVFPNQPMRFQRVYKRTDNPLEFAIARMKEISGQVIEPEDPTGLSSSNLPGTDSN